MKKKNFENLLEKIKTISVSSSLPEFVIFLTSDEVFDLTKKMSTEQRFEFLCFPIVGPDSIYAGLVVAGILVRPGLEEQFTRITQGLSVEQRFELLQGKFTNPQFKFFGETLAMIVIKFKRNDDFTRLTQGFSVEQHFELLQGNYINPQNVNVGMTLAMILISYIRYEDFTRLTQGLSVEKRFELLQGKLTNPQSENVGVTLAMCLVLRGRYDDFTRLTQGLSVEKRFELLQGKLTNPQCENVGMTLAMCLIFKKRYEDFTRLLQGFSGKEIVKLTDNSDHANAILKVLCEREQIKALNNVLDQCDYESLQIIYNRLADEAIEMEFVVFHCFQKLDLLLVLNIQGESCKNVTEKVFKNILNALFAYQHQITKPDLKIQSLEYLQSLFWEITKSRQCVTWTYEVFNDGKTLNEEEQDAFDSLKKISKRKTIDNFGFYLSSLCLSGGKHLYAKVLARRHAEMLEAAVTKSTYANVLEDLGGFVGDRATLDFQDDIVDKKTEQGKKRKRVSKTVPGKERSLDLQKSIKLS